MVKILLTSVYGMCHGSSPFFQEEKLKPQGLLSLAGSLASAGVEVDFIDSYVDRIDLKTYVEDTQPDYVGISLPSVLYQNGMSMIREIEDLDVKIVVGGPHASQMPESLPPRVDHIVINEGEQALVDLVTGKVDSRIISYPAIEDINTLPDPKWDLCTKYKYHNTTPFLSGSTFESLCTSRGCPYNCQFCSNTWMGKKYRCLTAENTLRQMKYHIDTSGCKSFYLREDNFTIDVQRVEKFCELARPYDLEFVCESRVNNLTKELLTKMRDAGCRGFYLGCESASQRMLDIMKKGITVEMIREKVNLIHSLGMNVMASWLINYIGETPEERNSTFELANELGAKINNYNIFVGIPRSPAYDYLIKHPELVEKIDDNFLIRPNGYSDLAKQIYGFSPP